MILKFVYIGCAIIAILIVLSLYANMRDLIQQNNLLKQERDTYQKSISHLRSRFADLYELAIAAQEFPCEITIFQSGAVEVVRRYNSQFFVVKRFVDDDKEFNLREAEELCELINKS